MTTPTGADAEHPRITIEQGKMNGRPCIRGMRIPVSIVLGMLSAGMSDAEILVAYPDLASEDLAASQAYAQAFPDKMR